MFREPAAPYVLIGIGAVIAVIAFLGCCGAIMQNTCMLMSVRKYIYSSIDFVFSTSTFIGFYSLRL